MTDALLLPYLDHHPKIGKASLGPGSALIGRVTLGDGAVLGRLVTLRADGHDIGVGADCRFLDRATVHIADSIYPAIMGGRITVGRYALVHACTLAQDCVIGDAAVVMDNATVGAGAVIAAGALVPPGKTLEGGWLHAGNPARPVREITPAEREAMRAALIAGEGDETVCYGALPPLTMDPYRVGLTGAGPVHALGGATPELDPATYVAPTALVAGAVESEPDSSIWFSCVLRAEGARIRIGARSNVQDNSILLAKAGDIAIGTDVTIGHNVRMGACTIGDHALIGMGAEMEDGIVVEDGAIVGARAFVEAGTVVKAGHVWAGRPAALFRPVKPEEATFFRRGKEVYVGYARAYLAQAA